MNMICMQSAVHMSSHLYLIPHSSFASGMRNFDSSVGFLAAQSTASCLSLLAGTPVLDW